MQIVKQTSSELSLRNQPSNLTKGFISVWALLFSGIPLVMMGVWIYGLGVTRLSCQRVEPTQVSCDRTQSRLLDLIPGTAATIDQVTAAAMKTETGIDSNGTRTVDHWVVLQTNNSEVTYAESAIRINGHKGSAEEMQSIANQVNEFLTSEQPSWTHQQDMRFRLGHSIFPLSFMGLFVVIGGTVIYFSFRSEILVFNKTSRQFHCIRQTLLGEKTWHCPLQEIRGVTVDTQINNEGTSTYTLKLLPQQGKPTLIPGSKDQVEMACDTILEFLQLGQKTASSRLTSMGTTQQP